MCVLRLYGVLCICVAYCVLCCVLYEREKRERERELPSRYTDTRFLEGFVFIREPDDEVSVRVL